MHRKTCKGCDNQFVALRTDAVTCSAKCRKRYERHCRAITKRMQALDKKRVEQFEKLCEEADQPER